MYEHLRTWTYNPSESVSMRLDLWDTGRTRDGKSELRYALWIGEGSLSGNDTRSAIFEGEQFWPSPLHAIDSDETAAALICFMAADGEAIRYREAGYGRDDDDDERLNGYTEKQRAILSANDELLSLWESELTAEA